jgi:hypothetical protein
MPTQNKPAPKQDKNKPQRQDATKSKQGQQPKPDSKKR